MQGGNPVVRGTRLTVDFVHDLLAQDWSREAFRENHPRLSDEVLQAIFAYAAEVLHDHRLARMPWRRLMRLPADEKVPLVAVRALDEAGHDVVSATESVPGTAEPHVLARARQDGRVIVTFDRDCGALTARDPTGAPGVILLRLDCPSAPAPGAFLCQLLARTDLAWRVHTQRDHSRPRPPAQAFSRLPTSGIGCGSADRTVQ